MAEPVSDRLGRPLRDLRISVVDRCNFRCTFCMPAGHAYRFLPRRELLTFEEIERLARLFVALGVERIRLTGGEPLLRAEIERLVSMLSAIPGVEDLALTTNGFLLAKQAAGLRAAGLRRVTVSLESLDNETFGRVNGVGASVERVLAGIERAAQEGLGPIKINTVVMRGTNDHEIVDIARYARTHGWIVRFIEFMDVGTLNRWHPEGVVSAREIIEKIGAELPLEPVARDNHSDPASRYRYLDGSGEIGVIASITEPFCGACSRARLTSEGRLLTCLFAEQGLDLKSMLRGGSEDRELLEAMRSLWQHRDDRYSERRAELLAIGRQATQPRMEMFRIGG